MKIGKKILVGSVLLIFITTPILANTEVDDITKASTSSFCDNNCLGTVWCKHQPLLSTIFTNKGLITDYDPPVGNPNYIYEFPEDENGYVHLNFTLHVWHLKNPIPGYLLPYRNTGITLYINRIEEYCYSKTLTLCETPYFVEYNISLIGLKPLFTNGTNVTMTFFGGAYPVPSIFKTPLFGLWIDFCETKFIDVFIDRSITIVPI